MALAHRLAHLSDRLRDVSARGLRFSKGIYDQENYRIVQEAAIELHGLATAAPVAALEPLRAAHFARSTPLVVGDAAILDAQRRLLLIQRADNKRWAMPGGALEVGETPAQGVEREAFEETGVRCRAHTLAGVWDSRLCGTTSAFQLYQFVFVCAPTDLSGFGRGSHAHEILDLGWFGEAALPAGLDPGHASRLHAVFGAGQDGVRAFFDQTVGEGTQT